MEETGIDFGTLRQILRVFYDNTHHMHRRLIAAFADGDRENLRHLSHSLKGSSANIGAFELMKSAETLEHACKSGGGDEYVRELLKRVEAELDSVRTVLGEALACEDSLEREESVYAVPGESSPVDTEKLKSLGDNLMAALEDCEPSKIKMYFTELMAIAGTRRTQRLKQLIDHFDYLSAVDELAAILESD